MKQKQRIQLGENVLFLLLLFRILQIEYLICQRQQQQVASNYAECIASSSQASSSFAFSLRLRALLTKIDLHLPGDALGRRVKINDANNVLLCNYTKSSDTFARTENVEQAKRERERTATRLLVSDCSLANH